MRVLTKALSIPLYRNAYALMLNVGASTILGYSYWIVAARLYSPEIVGINSAAISAQILVAGLATLNIEQAIIRFIPNLKYRRRFVIRVYLLTASLAAILAIALLYGQQLLDATNSFLALGPGFLFWFTFASATWCIFNLQDNVLTGLRQAVYVPIENMIFGVVKLILIVTLASFLPVVGIFASWTIPVFVSLFPISWLIFKRLIPNYDDEVEAERTTIIQVAPKTIINFVATDFIAKVFVLSRQSLMPLLVVAFVGATENAYYFTANSIAFAPILMAGSISRSMLVESSLKETEATNNARRMLLQVIGILYPAIIGIVIFSPLILSLFGPDYRENGTFVLRVIALAAIPGSLNSLAVALFRLRYQIVRVIMIEAVSSIIPVVGVIVLGPQYGLKSVAWAILVSQIITLVLFSGSILLKAIQGKQIVVSDKVAAQTQADQN